ncbi:Rne/Rng family ribonuclease [Psychrobacter sp. Rd 27.2]|uniref:Rne/Rng family ribonuclease n=1 Tax=Psychrobacter sp. Rd 27.2 TaxID=1926479 RepID=UPI00094695DA|nr:Rne/Rng family ribonuclease [Psychrobacter sp. Rd 27.2]OLF40609.1 ribonuclease [Psychrobacter sp. Rd 27.2]
MKRILINATQNEEIRVALCKGNHLYDFDLENRTREQKKSNIYKGHVTRVEPSLEAVFVEYGSQRQGFLPIREISAEYLSGNPRDENIKKLIKEGDELIVQVEKEERGNKGAALSTYVSLAGRYLVLMPNNPRGGGISRQISGKLREDMKRMLGNLDLPKGMSVIIRTAGIGKTQEDLQHDLNHLLNIWQAIQEQNKKYPSPRLVHQEAGVVTRAVRDYLRDDIAEIWIDNENAYIEAAGFIDAVMPKQAEKLRKYTDYEPMFSRFNIEKQIETAYQREVRLPSGGSIVIDQTEALVSIDINSAKSTKGSDVAETAYHTNLEAADEIARQLRLRDMGGLIVIDFIDMNDNKHQKEVEKRLIDATKYDRARVQFGDISKFGLMEMSRQRLRPSLEESTGYICPRCHGNGMIRDLRSLSLSIMRQIEQIALKERQGEVQAEVPTDIAAFLLNEKRDSLVYLEQDSGTRITILPHAHLESPNFKLHFNRDGFAPSSYERITDTQQQEYSDLGYDVDWQTADNERPEQQPTRQPRQSSDKSAAQKNKIRAQAPSNAPAQAQNNSAQQSERHQKDRHQKDRHQNNSTNTATRAPQADKPQPAATPSASVTAAQPQAVAWLSNLFAQAPQASTTPTVSSRDAAEAIEALVNTGAQSLGAFGQIDNSALSTESRTASTEQTSQAPEQQTDGESDSANRQQPRRSSDNKNEESNDDRRRRKSRKSRSAKPRQRKEQNGESNQNASADTQSSSEAAESTNEQPNKRQQDNRRSSERSRNNRQDNGRDTGERHNTDSSTSEHKAADEQPLNKRKSHSQRGSRGKLERGETLTSDSVKQSSGKNGEAHTSKQAANTRRNQDPNEVMLQVNEAPAVLKSPEVVHLSLDDSKPASAKRSSADKPHSANDSTANDTASKKDAGQAATAKSDSQKSPADKQSANSQSVEKSGKNDTTAQADTSGDKAARSKAVTANEQATAKQPTADEPSAANSPATRPASEPASADRATATKSQDTAANTGDRDTGNANSSAAKQTHATAKGTQSISAQSSPTADKTDADVGAAPLLTHDALFANRYVTAQKFGQASNDPRVVRRQQAQPTQQPAVESATPVPTVRGSVGDFVRQALTDAESRLKNDGVIRCFIAAIEAHSQQAKSADTAQAHLPVADAQARDFDFSNYGYQPLAADYLARFEAMTQAVSQFATTQGKTAVAPRAIGKRASNDPRGQHPDYQADEVDAHDVDATALANQAQADDVSTESEQLLKADKNVAPATNPSADHVDNTDSADNTDTRTKTAESDSEAAKQGDTSESEAPSKDADKGAEKEDSQAAKSKTTIASYKNMIENVAEQLLPQTGMFNLTTPKVPKARSRKPKTEHKKPTQAEKPDAEDADKQADS